MAFHLKIKLIVRFTGGLFHRVIALKICWMNAPEKSFQQNLCINKQFIVVYIILLKQTIYET